MKLLHRYHSTLHGNYRAAGLRSGLLTGAVMGGYAAVCLLMRRPLEAPTSLIVDALLLVGLFLLGAYYRNALPDKKVTLKEMMLFGMGTALVAALVYGLSLWALGLSSAQQTLLFTHTMTGKDILPEDPQLHYWAAWWAIVAFVESALVGCFGAFIAAVLYRNEKPETHQRTKHNNNGHIDSSASAE